MMKFSPPILLLALCVTADAYTTPNLSAIRPSVKITQQTPLSRSSLFRKSSSISSTIKSISTNAEGESSETTNNDSIMERKKKEHKARIKELGGVLAFPTPVGGLNPYGIFYGLTAIGLGIVWWLECTACRLLYFLTRNRFDKMRRLPVFFSQVWGELLMKITRANPEYVNKEILKEFYKQGRAAMFVANHNSWQDIPYLGSTIGWKNYKIVAKKELEKVPILSTAILAGGNVVLDRTNRRSQLTTLKTGIQWLKDGVHLCTFPEGTRSKTGRLNEFKNGAFKMAHKAGAPVIPLSIVAAGKVMPVDFMFPIKSSKGVAKVIVHEPIESEGKTEDELAEAVRQAIISGLPEDQRPLD